MPAEIYVILYSSEMSAPPVMVEPKTARPRCAEARADIAAYWPVLWAVFIQTGWLWSCNAARTAYKRPCSNTRSSGWWLNGGCDPCQRILGAQALRPPVSPLTTVSIPRLSCPA